jgi:hypothetical protein
MLSDNWDGDRTMMFMTIHVRVVVKKLQDCCALLLSLGLGVS